MGRCGLAWRTKRGSPSKNRASLTSFFNLQHAYDEPADSHDEQRIGSMTHREPVGNAFDTLVVSSNTTGIRLVIADFVLHGGLSTTDIVQGGMPRKLGETNGMRSFAQNKRQKMVQRSPSFWKLNGRVSGWRMIFSSRYCWRGSSLALHLWSTRALSVSRAAPFR